jgi:hypothetical protein
VPQLGSSAFRASAACLRSSPTMLR